ncbi:hypothetical protein [Microbacterium sp. F2]
MTQRIPVLHPFVLGRPGLGRGAGVKRLVIQPPPAFARRRVEHRQERAS